MPSSRLSLKKARGHRQLRLKKVPSSGHTKNVVAGTHAWSPQSPAKKTKVSTAQPSLSRRITFSPKASPLPSAASGTASGPRGDVGPLQTCPICKLSIVHLLVLEQEVHVNNCLDIKLNDELLARNHARNVASGAVQAKQDSRDPSAMGEVVGRIWCPICDKDLTLRTLEDRVHHTENCMKSVTVSPFKKVESEATATGHSSSDSESSDSDDDIIAAFDGGGENQQQSTVEVTDYDDDFDNEVLRSKSSNSTPKSVNTSNPLSSTAGKEATGRKGTEGSAFATMMRAGKRTSKSSTTPKNAFEMMKRGVKLQAAKKKAREQQKQLGGGRRSWSFQNSRRRPPETCPFFKKMRGLSQTLIVDGFQWACSQLARFYILTHFHSDHYGGLTSKFNCGTIYCTEITARLTVAMLGVDEKYVVGVPLDTPIDVPECGARLTFMEANHCPGAAIILIENTVTGQALLHTGDFRFTPAMLDYPPLKPFLQTEMSTCRRLAAVYLDTTYCDPRYRLPTQEDTVNAVVNEVNAARIEGPGSRTLFLFGTYSIGKERVFLAVARRCGIKVAVSAAKMKMIRSFNWPSETMDLLTTDCASTRFHAVPMGHINGKKAQEYLSQWKRYTRVIGFRPTGWAHGGGSRRRSQTAKRYKPQMSAVPGMMSRDQKNSLAAPLKRRRHGPNCIVYSVAYSEHSSFSELQDFIKSYAAERIIPTVNARSAEQARKLVALLKSPSYAL